MTDQYGLKWYFALSAASLKSRDHDWRSLIRAALSSARRHTTLRPHLLWDGPPAHELAQELRRQGVTVIPHRVPFYAELERHKPEPHWLGIASGAFLRVEIPVLEQEDEFVLYTDADVMFLADPSPALRQARPRYFAGCSEFTFQDGLNSGVLLLNLPQMRADYPAFISFIRQNLHLGLDQEMYRRFYDGKWEPMPPEFNWKPYWGENPRAQILHWHGIKPVVVRRLFSDVHASTHPELQALVARNPAGYRHYLSIHEAQFAPVAQEPCAVVLVVRDEASDILAWLAWYKLLGFSAAIVYDDDSTDGTWELLQQAASHWDIRLSRTPGQREKPHTWRQDEAYRHAIATYKGEFAWLAFFDADEFLSLRQDETVTAFLARFPGADEVAVNWCNYGSSGHALKPAAPPPLAYTWHGDAHRAINRHVKCFVRPRAVGAAWRGVHCFDVAPDRAVLASGAPLRWGGTEGIIDAAPDWSVAKLMHFQCRSMEHFIERLKKYPQLQGGTHLWASYDMRDAEDVWPQRLAPRLEAEMALLSGALPPAVPGLVFLVLGTAAEMETVLAAGGRVVAVEPDVRRYYALAERFAAEIAAGRVVLENYAPGPVPGGIILFTPEDGGRPYHVASISWAQLVEAHGMPERVQLGRPVPGFLPAAA
ncbi:MAG: glycosyltransferase family 2 protein [Acidocella sp.]|nr:glycosyltransferase family 2 protein [Acidocella sp.]